MTNANIDKRPNWINWLSISPKTKTLPISAQNAAKWNPLWVNNNIDRWKPLNPLPEEEVDRFKDMPSIRTLPFLQNLDPSDLR